MSHKVNLVRVLTAATGNSSPIQLDAAYSQLFMTPAEAGAMNGRVYSYLIVDGNNWEYGRGVYTSSGTTLARNVIASRIGGTLGTARINLSGTAQVRFVELAEDMDGVRGTRPVTGTSDTLVNSDQGYVVTYNNASAVAVSLAQAGASGLFLDGWATFVKNKGAGIVTITPATSTIEGNATLQLKQKQAALIWSDGTNYDVLMLRGDLGTAATHAEDDFVRYDAGQSKSATEKAQARANAGVLGRSRIINGQFLFNQRGAASVADNAYGPDRFRVLGEFATGTIYTDAFDAAGGSASGGALQFPGTSDKGGFFQVIEGRNCKDLRSKTVTLSARLVVNNTRLGNMKMGVLEWTGTEDATTGDPVSSWGAEGVTPTLAANWAFKNSPVNLNVSTTSALYSVTATLGSTFNNLAVIIWNDDKSYSANDNFSITNVQLEEGGVATPYDQRFPAQELYLSQRYFSLLPGWVGKWINANVCQLSGSFWTKMRATPSVTVAFGTAALNDYGVANINLISFSAAAIGDSGGYLNLNTATGTANALCGYLDNVGKVFLSAEI